MITVAAGARKFLGFIYPSFYAARLTFPAYRTTFFLIVFFTGIATLFQAGSLGLIYHLLQNFSGQPAAAPYDFPLVEAFFDSTAALTLTAIVLLGIGVRIKYVMIRKTLQVMAESGWLAGKLGLVHAKHLFHSGQVNLPGSRDFKVVASTLVKDLPFACGFASRGFTIITINLVQSAILLAVMIYLSPVLTLSVLTVGAIGLGLLAVTYENVLVLSQERDDHAPKVQAEADELAVGLGDQGVSQEQFLGEAEAAFSSGKANKQLEMRIAVRMERSTGSLVVEYVYPMALLGIFLMYTFSEGHAPAIGMIAVYFLLTRQVIASMAIIAKTFLMFSKRHVEVEAFFDLMENEVLPGKLAVDGVD